MTRSICMSVERARRCVCVRTYIMSSSYVAVLCQIWRVNSLFFCLSIWVPLVSKLKTMENDIVKYECFYFFRVMSAF
ncbi:hypothetical protein Mapa_015836 [Marchantia paleacea]|nr:hypothetical protein Mapa_015836 [Marchantia paleacea]